MNVMLSRHGARHIYVVPEGLRELLSDICREVLRTQPEKIYCFVADYLDALMVTRENARVAARVVESLADISITIAQFLLRTGMTKAQADKTAVIIQTAFREHTARKKHPRQKELPDEKNVIDEIIEKVGITTEQAQKAARIIQMAYRSYRERQLTFEAGDFIDWRMAMRNTMSIYRQSNATSEEAYNAAVTIQAAYRGYYTRRILKMQPEESIPSDETNSFHGQSFQFFYPQPDDKDELDYDFTGAIGDTQMEKPRDVPDTLADISELEERGGEQDELTPEQDIAISEHQSETGTSDIQEGYETENEEASREVEGAENVEEQTINEDQVTITTVEPSDVPDTTDTAVEEGNEGDEGNEG